MQQALRSLSYGACVVSTARNDEKATLLSPWVTQVNLEPPTLAVSLPAGSTLVDFLRAGAPFAVSVLRAGQRTIAEQVLRSDQGIGEDHPRTHAEKSAPYLADALAVFECEH